MSLLEWIVLILSVLGIYAVALWIIRVEAEKEAEISNMIDMGDDWPDFDKNNHKFTKP
jgi:hypothetical protein